MLKKCAPPVSGGRVEAKSGGYVDLPARFGQGKPRPYRFFNRPAVVKWGRV